MVLALKIKLVVALLARGVHIKALPLLMMVAVVEGGEGVKEKIIILGPSFLFVIFLYTRTFQVSGPFPHISRGYLFLGGEKNTVGCVGFSPSQLRGSTVHAMEAVEEEHC